MLGNVIQSPRRIYQQVFNTEHNGQPDFISTNWFERMNSTGSFYFLLLSCISESSFVVVLQLRMVMDW